MSVVDTVIQSLLQNLTSLVFDEVKKICGVKEQMESLQNELKLIDIFLKSSIGNRNDDLVKEVVNQIRDIAYKAQDVVDMYTAKVSEHESRSKLGKFLHLKDHAKMLRSVDDDIGKINRDLEKINKNMARFNIDFKNKDIEAPKSLHRKRRNVDEEDVVHDSTVVIKELEKEETCRRRTVVSIIGMGGLGKTTLAKKIYNTDRIKRLFPYRAFVYVSNDYRPKELLLTILDSSQYKDLSEEELMQKVRERLEGEKYLIVLDDIWETKVWDEVQAAFPSDSGGRILITSRNKDVSSHARAALAYELPFLNKEESWKLFSRKVFQEEDCPSDLVEVGKSMVEDCGGLPLAIIVLAGAAATKKSQIEWLRIKDGVHRRHADNQKATVMCILKLSYDKLPQELKPCFLYFAMYPEDYEIHVEELIQLWIAEGFIQVTERSNPLKLEDVAKDYLDELVDLSLVQVATRRRSDGSVKSCRIHDLLRDLCISESKDEKFLDVCKSASSNPRRWSCQCIKESCIITSNNKGNQSCIRSLICFSNEFPDQRYPVKSFVERFKLARVLDFGTNMYKVPNGFKTFIHLRYLRIDVGSSRDILACIFCLSNLEVLKIDASGFYKHVGKTAISNYSGMWKLKRLRYLYAFPAWVVSTSEDMSKPESEIMSNLQTLCSVKLGPQTPSVLNNERFPNLIKLSMKVYSSDQEESFRRLSRISSLRTLRLYTKVNLPSNDTFLSNLTNITLEYLSGLECLTMGTFGKLTSLQVFKIRCHSKVDINCAAGDFPNLKVFKIDLMIPTNWRLGEGAMPRLERVVIHSCHSLEGLPEELWSLPTLQNVEIEYPSVQLEKSLKDVMVKNGCKNIITK